MKRNIQIAVQISAIVTVEAETTEEAAAIVENTPFDDLDDLEIVESEVDWDNIPYDPEYKLLPMTEHDPLSLGVELFTNDSFFSRFYEKKLYTVGKILQLSKEEFCDIVPAENRTGFIYGLHQNGLYFPWENVRKVPYFATVNQDDEQVDVESTCFVDLDSREVFGFFSEEDDFSIDEIESFEIEIDNDRFSALCKNNQTTLPNDSYWFQ